jgi:hypothetical protein
VLGDFENEPNQFFGDLSLTLAVVIHRQLVDHLAGIARGVIHGAHACALLGSRIFEQRPKNLHRNVSRNEIVEDRHRIRFVFIGGIAAAFPASSLRRRPWRE